MKKVALRFTNNSAPVSGPVGAHDELIIQFGYAYYGKICARISHEIVKCILQNQPSRILLIHSGAVNRY